MSRPWLKPVFFKTAMLVEVVPVSFIIAHEAGRDDAEGDGDRQGKDEVEPPVKS